MLITVVVALGLRCPNVLEARQIMDGESGLGGPSGSSRCQIGVDSGGEEPTRFMEARMISSRMQWL